MISSEALSAGNFGIRFEDVFASQEVLEFLSSRISRIEYISLLKNEILMLFSASESLSELNTLRDFVPKSLKFKVAIELWTSDPDTTDDTMTVIQCNMCTIEELALSGLDILIPEVPVSIIVRIKFDNFTIKKEKADL